MISETTYKLSEKLNQDELNILNELVINKILNILPDKIHGFDNELIDLEYFKNEDSETLFSISSNQEFGNVFNFNNEVGVFDVKHHNLSYSFIINSFLLCLKNIAPKKVTIYKNEQNWTDYGLFTHLIFKNTDFTFFDFEFIEYNCDEVVHISSNNNLTAYRETEEYNFELEEEFDNIKEDESDFFEEYDDSLEKRTKYH